MNRQSQQEACDTTREASQRALDDELARQPSRARADRRAQRHLALARRRARQLQAGDVGRRRDEQERNRRQQDENRRAHLGGHRLDGRCRRDVRRRGAAKQSNSRQSRIGSASRA